MNRGLCALGLLVLASGCVRKTVEIRVRDPGLVGVNGVDARGIVPVLPADGKDRSAPIAAGPWAPHAVRVGRELTAAWPGHPEPISLVDVAGVLPSEKPNRGIAVSRGWLYATYALTPKRVLPDGDVPAGAVPLVLMTPVDNIAEVNEVHEPRRWPAYVFLPVGGTFGILGGGLLALGTGEEETKMAGAVYLTAGVSLFIYGLVNLVASTEATPAALPPDRGP